MVIFGAIILPTPSRNTYPIPSCLLVDPRQPPEATSVLISIVQLVWPVLELLINGTNSTFSFVCIFYLTAYF